MGHPKCRGCGRRIHFIKMAKTGKPMPCDLNPVPIVRYKGGKPYVSVDGYMVYGEEVDMGGEDLFAYLPHWSTCEGAEKIKRAKRVTAAPAAEKKPPQHPVAVEEDAEQLTLGGMMW